MVNQYSVHSEINVCLQHEHAPQSWQLHKLVAIMHRETEPVAREKVYTEMQNFSKLREQTKVCITVSKKGANAGRLGGHCEHYTG